MNIAHIVGATSASEPAHISTLIAAIADEIITKSKLAFDEDERKVLLDILIGRMEQYPASEIELLASYDFSLSEAADFINHALDGENPALVAEATTATTQLPQRESIVTTGVTAPTHRTLKESVSVGIETSETGRGRPFLSTDDQAEASGIAIADWSLGGRRIDSTIEGEKCGASLNQYGDHPATTTCSPRVIADVERTMLRTDEESISRDAGHDEWDDELVDAPADVETGNFALVADTTAATTQLPVAIFDADFFGVQIWHNPNPVAGQSYWSIKIRSSQIPEIDDDDDNAFDPSAMDQFQLHFRSSPRNFRKMLTAALDAKKIDLDFASYLRGSTGDMHTNTQVALLSQPIHKKFVTVAKGKSTREVRFVDRVWATLLIDQGANAPAKLTIMHPDREPVVISSFESTAGALTKSGKQRKSTSAGWLAFYDPHGLYAEMKREKRAQEHYQAENINLTFYNPASRLGKFVTGYVKPIADVVEDHGSEINNLKSLVRMLSDENGRQADEIAEMRNQIAEMRMAFEAGPATPIPASASEETAEPPHQPEKEADQTRPDYDKSRIAQGPIIEHILRLIEERKAQQHIEGPQESSPDPAEPIIQKKEQDSCESPLPHWMRDPHARAMFDRITQPVVLTEREAAMIRSTSEFEPGEETYIDLEQSVRDFLKADGDPYGKPLEAFWRGDRRL